MARMRAVDAAVQVLECEGIDCAFGVPGAAINPFYSAMKARGPTRHILARHVEAASHMAEGYTPAKAGNISLCIGTSGPAGTDMITGLYSASADSIPILCVTGQAPRAAAQGGLPGDRHRGHRGSGRQVGEDRHGAPLGVRAADPDRRIVALSGDYDFQFLNEELAVGAQHRLPCIHVVVNNAYLGLIRQAQRGFGMDFEVSLAFENVNTIGHAEIGYGVDHVKVAEAMGCKAVRVRRPEEFAAGFAEAERLMAEHKVPVLLEFILERVTNIAMGTEIDDIIEFENLAERNEDAPTAIALLG